ncbi:uncharacterized protein K452DRAFT_356277 [Aplosporella prunicola CBS 121167]|uniref:Uncharacterized protein n=1 Tax=Aplosporella prunicola CBS 121167 TaxID=1176127 RepID=A0A6A6BNT4_9PEZI|nr:uncharacterized protein K452DRAFT_356277 [Aplosporella prunicola CBS 121167]KAF2144925.1 hypothetical protein K452DRAFT_356277 [Aplosporella prunicola CBS 121167]
MSVTGLEVSVAVTAVVSAFQSAAGLVEILKKRHWRRRSDEAYREKALLESLEAGAVQIEDRYAADCKELGPEMRTGDDTARNRLLHIAITMQCEVIRSLQIGVQNEAAVIDLTVLHETAVMNKRDALTALAELRQRIFADSPEEAPRPSRPGLGLLSSSNSRSPMSSTPRFRSSAAGPKNLKNLPSAVTIPSEEECKSRLSRVLSHKRTSFAMSRKPDSRKLSSQAGVAGDMQWFAYKTPDNSPASLHELPAEVPQRLRTCVELPPPAYSPVNPAATPQRKKSPESDYFPDNPRPVHPLERELSPSPNEDTPRQDSDALPSDYYTHKQLNAAIMNWTGGLKNSQANNNHDDRTNERVSRNTSASTESRHSNPHDMSAASSNQSSSSRASTCPTPVDSTRHSCSSAPNSPSETPSSNELTPTLSPQTLTTYPTHRSWTSESSFNSNLSRVSTIPRAPISITSRPPLPRLGRPCKENNYWNFCKGAWSLCEDFKKGLELRTKPIGMYTSALVWQCRTCAFEGPSFGAKKPYSVDPRAHELAVSLTSMGPDGPHPGTRVSFGGGDGGATPRPIAPSEGRVRYRWIFLAKSHARARAPRVEMARHSSTGSAGAAARGAVAGDRPGYSYGCTLCCAEGRLTAVFGTAETLLRHVYLEHGGRGVSKEVCERTKCVVGRWAGRDEEWEVNILGPKADDGEGGFSMGLGMGMGIEEGARVLGVSPGAGGKDGAVRGVGEGVVECQIPPGLKGEEFQIPPGLGGLMN